MPTRRQSSYLLIICGTLLVACGGTGDPTKPANPTPTPTPTVATCTAAQPVTSFTATPATITSGDSFTLSWAAPCGYVSLAQKDQGPFVTLQPSTGSYTLTQGGAGYPAGAGTTVYVATNGDTAQRLEATVTMNSKAVPTISLAGAGSCYPVKAGNAGCNVPVTATASNYDSISWSGCCAGSSGTNATCHVSNPGSFTCSASATGPGGSAQASLQVTGTNATPVISRWDTNYGHSDPPCDADMTIGFYITDEEGAASCPTVVVAGYCGYVRIECPVANPPTIVNLFVHTAAPPPRQWAVPRRAGGARCLGRRLGAGRRRCGGAAMSLAGYRIGVLRGLVGE